LYPDPGKIQKENPEGKSRGKILKENPGIQDNRIIE
jgi:hypothetical protein